MIHIGKSQYTDPFLISVLTSVSLPLFPNLDVSLSSMSIKEIEAEVLLGKLDLAVAIGNFGNSKITQLELLRTPFFIAVPERSELSHYRELTLSHLPQKTWVMFERHVHPVLYDSVMRTAAQEGVQPRFVRRVVTAEEAAQELYARTGEIAFLTRAGAWRIARNGLTMRPLRHSELCISAKLIARADDVSRIVSKFARTLKRMLDSPRRVQLDLPLPERKAS